MAESIILYMLERGFRKAKRVVVRIGALQSIDRDVLVFAAQELSKEYKIEVEEFKVVEESPLFKCNVCGYTWDLEALELDSSIREAIHFVPEAIYAYCKCPRCGSLDFEIARGRGLLAVEVEDHDR